MTTSTSQASVLTMITDWQSKVVDMNRDFVDAVKPIVANIPGAPLAKNLFDTSIIDRTFELTSELLNANRRFTHDLLAVWAPQGEAASTDKGRSTTAK